MTEPVSPGLHAEVLERASGGDDNRNTSPILLGVWSLWCGVLAGPAPARGKKKGAGKVEAAWGLGRRMWGVEMDGWQEGWRDRGIEGWTEGRMERKGAGCFPSPLHKAHAGASRNLLKEGTCLGALAWAGEIQGLDPQCSLPGTPPSPFLPWLWAAATPFMPALRASHIPAWPLQSVGLPRGAGDRREAGRWQVPQPCGPVSPTGGLQQ